MSLPSITACALCAKGPRDHFNVQPEEEEHRFRLHLVRVACAWCGVGPMAPCITPDGALLRTSHRARKATAHDAVGLGPAYTEYA